MSHPVLVVLAATLTLLSVVSTGYLVYCFREGGMPIRYFFPVAIGTSRKAGGVGYAYRDRDPFDCWFNATIHLILTMICIGVAVMLTWAP